MKFEKVSVIGGCEEVLTLATCLMIKRCGPAVSWPRKSGPGSTAWPWDNLLTVIGVYRQTFFLLLHRCWSLLEAPSWQCILWKSGPISCLCVFKATRSTSTWPPRASGVRRVSKCDFRGKRGGLSHTYSHTKPHRDFVAVVWSHTFGGAKPFFQKSG